MRILHLPVEDKVVELLDPKAVYCRDDNCRVILLFKVREGLKHRYVLLKPVLNVSTGNVVRTVLWVFTVTQERN